MHDWLERNSILLLIGIILVIAIGGAVEIAPLFWVNGTVEKVSGVRPYTPLEMAGRNIYMREGCYLCHSQQIRSLRDEVERYGHYSLAAESKYDHPFQWGSKRTGPDLARVGGKYTNDWHVRHLINPRDVVPESIMPGYPHLKRALDYSTISADMKALRVVAVPYTDDQIANAKKDVEEQVGSEAADSAIAKRYPKAKLGKAYAADPKVTELDALVAYLQVLGTFVDFTTVKPEKIAR